MEYKTKSNLREVLGQKPPGPPKIPHCWEALGSRPPPYGEGRIDTHKGASYMKCFYMVLEKNEKLDYKRQLKLCITFVNKYFW